MRNIKFRKFLAVSIIFLFLLNAAINAYAAYVGDPSHIFTVKDKERPYSFFTEGVTDLIYDRDAKFQSDDMRVEHYGATAGIIYNDFFALYGGLGATRVEEEFVISGTTVKWKSDHAFTWLAGGIFKIYESQLKKFYNGSGRLLVDLDIQYRDADLEPDVITIGSTEYNIPNSAIERSSMEYNDWHMALACGLDFGIFSPYAGIKYSDFESCPRAQRNGIWFEKDNAEADNNFGIFIGSGFKIAGSLSADVEASFIDENSISGSLSWKF